MAKTLCSKKHNATLHVGACEKVLPTIKGGSFDLIFADPPFNMGQKYAEHHDREHWAAYEAWTAAWIGACVARLKDGGSMFVHCPDEYVSFIDRALLTGNPLPAQEYPDVVFPALQRVNWIILHQSFGQFNDSRFIRSKQHLLWFCKGKYTFNVRDMLEPSDRLLRYKDKRVKTSKYKGYRPFFDTWYGAFLGRVQGTCDERWCKKSGALVDHPNQLPEMYMARIIRAATRPGDRVLDPFTGSGTTMVVASALGREFVGVEKGAQTARSAMKRLRRGPVRNVAGPLTAGDSRVKE